MKVSYMRRLYLYNVYRKAIYNIKLVHPTIYWLERLCLIIYLVSSKNKLRAVFTTVINFSYMIFDVIGNVLIQPQCKRAFMCRVWVVIGCDFSSNAIVFVRSFCESMCIDDSNQRNVHNTHTHTHAHTTYNAKEKWLCCNSKQWVTIVAHAACSSNDGEEQEFVSWQTSKFDLM